MIIQFKKILFLFFLCLAMIRCSPKVNRTMPEIKTYALRLKPGQDLKNAIQSFVNEKKLEAAWIVTCAGSLEDYNIRFANQAEPATGKGHFEIVSLTGTLSINGSHIHISISDSTGKTIGGHLQQGSVIYTTAEIIIQDSKSFVFKREKDGTTPWEELPILEKK